MSKLVEVQSEASKYEKVVQALAKIEKLDARLAALRGEKKNATAGWLPKDEVASRLVEFLRRRDRTFGAGKVAQEVTGVSFQKMGLFGWQLSSDGALDFVLWLLGPDHVEKLARAAVARDAYTEGISSAAREKLLAGLTAERERIVTEREALVETCHAAGVDVAHLQETAQRRYQDASAAAQAADVSAGLAKRQAELDAEDAIERAIHHRNEAGE